MAIQFKRATKKAAKGRIALIGPAGSGKSFTMLRLARLLAGPDGKVAAIDTEHGSLSKYADLFEFDVIELDSFSPENFLGALRAAEEAGYAAFCCDSLSHFWIGKDGALEFVDNRAKRSGSNDSFSGWKEFRPHERAMVDRMIASPCHVIVTMRTKNEYVTEKNDRGKTVRRKVGLAPVQREGMEYEFDLVGTMDDENVLVIDKTRCSAYAGKAISKPAEKDFEPFRQWLEGGERAPESAPTAPATKPEPAKQDTPSPSKAASQPSEGGSGNGASAANGAAAVPAAVQALWARMQGLKSTITALTDLLHDMVELSGSDTEFFRILHMHGLAEVSESGLRRVGLSAARKCARELLETLLRWQQSQAPPSVEITDDDLPPEMFPEAAAAPASWSPYDEGA